MVLRPFHLLGPLDQYALKLPSKAKEKMHMWVPLPLCRSPPPPPRSRAVSPSLFPALPSLRSAHLALKGPGPHLVTMLRFFRWLSAPGLSLSGSPFLGVCFCFMAFLFLALLMVVAQCLGRSCRNKRKGVDKCHSFLELTRSPPNRSSLASSFILLPFSLFPSRLSFSDGGPFELHSLLSFFTKYPSWLGLKVPKWQCVLWIRSSSPHPHPERETFWWKNSGKRIGSKSSVQLHFLASSNLGRQ